MGGWNGDALEWEALLSPRFLPRLLKLGVEIVATPQEANVLVVTGLLTLGNLDAVLQEIARMSQPSVLVAAGDAAIDGGIWARLDLPGLAPYPLSHYADVHITIPGNPPSPQALLVALTAESLLG
jgi:Ni,Fe-hydrogenase III small subunit